MRYVKFVFINYFPIFLLFPLTLSVGLWMFKNNDIFANLENRSFFYYYIFLAIIPFFLVVFPAKLNLPGEIQETLEKLFQRLNAHKWIFITISLLYIFVYLRIATIHISAYVERDRWILENTIPIIPYDPPLPARLAWTINGFVQSDLAVPLVGLFFVLLWFVFLIYVNGEKYFSPIFWIILFVSTFLNGTIFQLMYASMELPAAILSFIGLYGMWKGKHNVGILFLVVGGVWKNTGIFQIATGMVLFIYLCWREGSILRILRKIDMPLLVFGILYYVLNHWGSFYYALKLRGGFEYLVDLEGRIFWYSSFVDFIYILFKDYSPLFVLGALGVMFDKQVRIFSLFSIGVLLFLRCFQEWNHHEYPSGYFMIFIPGLSFFSLHGLKLLLVFLRANWTRALIQISIIGLSGVLFMEQLASFPYGMNRLNSNFDQYIGKLARRFPEVGRIYQRDITLRPYLTEHLGPNLNAIEFWIYPEQEKKFISELSLPGCKLIIATREHLAVVGITEAEMTSMGYSERPYILIDNSGTWVSYSKECNAWEYN